MRSCPRLGAANLALLSIYFAPVWGRDALHVMVSPYNGFEDPSHAAAVARFSPLFGGNLDGLIWTSNGLAAVKFVIAAAFLAYAIEFARSLVTAKDVDRHTVNVVLVLAAAGIVIWAIPAMVLDNAALVRLYATQLLLVAGAIFVIAIERHIDLLRGQQCGRTALMMEGRHGGIAAGVWAGGARSPIAARQ
jgi:hypothetical protein